MRYRQAVTRSDFERDRLRHGADLVSHTARPHHEVVRLEDLEVQALHALARERTFWRTLLRGWERWGTLTVAQYEELRRVVEKRGALV